MKYYIVVKLRFVGELYDVSGPYSSFLEAEEDMNMQHMIWSDSIGEDEYLSIVSRNN